jgi:hypothetical protein
MTGAGCAASCTLWVCRSCTVCYLESFSMTDKLQVYCDGTVVPHNQIVARPPMMSVSSFASRYPQHDGSDVSGEIRCLGKLLKMTPTISTNNSTCRVYLMSDRPLTLQNLQLWLQHRNCSVVTAPQRQAGASFLPEHGPGRVGAFSRTWPWCRRRVRV